MFYDIFWKYTGDFIIFHSDVALKDYKLLFQSNLVQQPVKEDCCMWLSILSKVSIHSTGKAIQDYQSQWTSSFTRLPFLKSSLITLKW